MRAGADQFAPPHDEWFLERVQLCRMVDVVARKQSQV